MTFTFNDKTSYLAYRKEWAQRYLAGIKAMREARQGIRDANRAYSKGGGIGDIWSAYTNLRRAQTAVSDLLSELWKAKKEAGRQMRAINPVNSRDTGK